MKTPSLFLIFFITLAVCACQNPWMADILDTKIITFDSAGGTPVPSQKLFKGERVQRPADPVRYGYTFRGWYNDIYKIDQLYDFALVPIGDMTLHARWDNDSKGETENPGGTPKESITIENLKNYLESSEQGNSPSEPVKVKLNISSTDDLNTLKDILNDVYKYVELDLSGNITSIDIGAFEKCTRLTSITIPDSVTSIGNTAFMNCTSLTSVTIPNKVNSIGNAVFSGCDKLTAINVDAGNSAYSSQDEVLYNKNKTVLHTYPGGKKDAEFVIPSSVTSIGVSAFSYCTNLTNITIPDGVTGIEGGAFEGCTNLTNVNIPKEVTKIERYTFSHCDNLTSITIPDKVTSIEEYAFANCGNLTNVIIPDNVTGIKDGAFRFCANLASITIGKNVTSIGSNAFSGCTSLTSVTFNGKIAQNGFDKNAFEGLGDLHDKYFSQNNGGIGTYVKTTATMWTKQQ